MSRQSLRRRAASGCAAVILGVAGCSSSSADGSGMTTGSAGPGASVISVLPTGISASVVGSSPTIPDPSVIDVPTVVATPTSLDPEDRAAVEAQCTKYGETYINIVRTDPNERLLLAAEVAIDPAQSNLFKSAEYFESQGKGIIWRGGS